VRDATALLALVALAIAGNCGVQKLSDRQQRQLEARCQCRCVRVEIEDQTFQEWARTTGELTMAWGGGMWRCPGQ
jgi:hypothetical protein